MHLPAMRQRPSRCSYRLVWACALLASTCLVSVNGAVAASHSTSRRLRFAKEEEQQGPHQPQLKQHPQLWRAGSHEDAEADTRRRGRSLLQGPIATAGLIDFARGVANVGPRCVLQLNRTARAKRLQRKHRPCNDCLTRLYLCRWPWQINGFVR